jgi:hypothetical protein
MSAKAMFRQVSNRFRGPQVVGLSRAEDSAVNWLASDSSDRSSVRAWSRAKSHSKRWWCSEDNRFHRTVGASLGSLRTRLHIRLKRC